MDIYGALRVRERVASKAILPDRCLRVHVAAPAALIAAAPAAASGRSDSRAAADAKAAKGGSDCRGGRAAIVGLRARNACMHMDWSLSTLPTWRADRNPVATLHTVGKYLDCRVLAVSRAHSHSIQAARRSRLQLSLLHAFLANRQGACDV